MSTSNRHLSSARIIHPGALLALAKSVLLSSMPEPGNPPPLNGYLQWRALAACAGGYTSELAPEVSRAPGGPFTEEGRGAVGGGGRLMCKHPAWFASCPTNNRVQM